MNSGKLKTLNTLKDWLEKTSLGQRIAAKDKPLVLHSDNGSPIKAETFLAALGKMEYRGFFQDQW